MEVSGQFQAPCRLPIPPRKDILVPIGHEAGWAKDLAWILRRKEKSYVVGNQTLAVQLVGCHYSYWAIPTFINELRMSDFFVMLFCVAKTSVQVLKDMERTWTWADTVKLIPSSLEVVISFSNHRRNAISFLLFVCHTFQALYLQAFNSHHTFCAGN
jgi:hypothetical protein